MKKTYKYIGRSYPIHDSMLKVTGRQEYTGDLDKPGTLHAKLLFSEIGHGVVKKIDTTKAESLSGVIKVYTCMNTPEKTFSSYMFFVNQDTIKDERIFNKHVRFVGDRIAAVVAVNKSIAEEAAKLIEVEYEKYPVMVDIESSMEEKEYAIHSEGNIISEKELNVGNADSVFQESFEVFKDDFKTQKIHHAAIENHVSIAKYDSLGEMTIWSGCQSVFAIRNTVGEFLNLPYSKVRVKKTNMGGSFGGKQHVILELLVAYFAKDLEATVKLQFNREESIISTITRTATEFSIETGITNEGRITGCKIESLVDAGAYVANSVDLSVSMGKKAFRVYNIPNLNYKSKSVYTNTPISGGCRGWGCPQLTTAMETHFDKIAKKIDIDPAEFRLKNLVKPYDMELLSKITLGNARIRDCLEQGLKDFDWYKRKGTIDNSRRYKKGIGLACGGHVNGFYGKIQDFCSMILIMNEDGTLVLNTGVHDMGCGTITSLTQIVAEVLEIDMSLVKVLEADTERSPYDLGTFSSRVTYVSGKCAHNAANKIKKLIVEQAGMILGKSPSYIELGDGFAWPAGEPENKISYKDIAAISQVKYEVDIMAKETYSNVSNPGAYAAHFAEVEVDTETGLIAVTDYLAVHDVGKAINRSMIEGQVQGGVHMGLGYALYEEIKINSEGRSLNSSFKNYTLANVWEMPDVKVRILEFGGDDGPFEAKSVGEIAVVPVAAAIVNAVNDALDSSFSEIPLTPEKIIMSLQ